MLFKVNSIINSYRQRPVLSLAALLAHMKKPYKNGWRWRLIQYEDIECSRGHSQRIYITNMGCHFLRAHRYSSMFYARGHDASDNRHIIWLAPPEAIIYCCAHIAVSYEYDRNFDEVYAVMLARIYMIFDENIIIRLCRALLDDVIAISARCFVGRSTIIFSAYRSHCYATLGRTPSSAA